MSDRKKCLLTGATGHVGYAILLELLAQGADVTLLLRKQNRMFDGFACDTAIGDVTDCASLEKAFAGMDTVYHVAGAVEIGKGREDFTWKINFEGTKNVLRACRACGVRRLVYMSTVDVFKPLPGDAVMAEQTHFDPAELTGAYAKSKAAATQYLIDNHGEVELVVLHPSACIGPYDFKGSSMGEGLKMFMSGKFPVTMNFGAYNFVDVRDVAKGAVAAAEKGRNGACYILSGELVTVDGFIRIVNDIMGFGAPKITLSHGMMRVAAPVMELYYNLSGAKPLFTRYTVRKLTDNCNFSHEKATRELGYAPMGARESLADTIAWMKENI